MLLEVELKNLYGRGLSMMDIAKKLGKSHHQVVYWMNKYDIPRRSWSDATYIKRNPNGDPFHIKEKLTPKERELKGLGLGIFWGEGGKTNRISTRLGNTDPRLIKKFIEFLKKICGIRDDKLHFELIIFNDSDPQKARNFWSDQLNIDTNRIGKSIIIPPQGKGTYKNKNQHGVLTVCCHNTKFKKWIDEQIKTI